MALESPRCNDSLLLSLAEIFHSLGRDTPLDELAVITGISSMTPCIVDDHHGLRLSNARHYFLESACRLYGIQLRGLHPPPAAPLPLSPPEFDLHFRDSYIPLIRAALEKGERVLSWMGWPPPHHESWGLITTADPAAGTCSGIIPSLLTTTAPMSGPAMQTYTIAPFTEQPADPSAILAETLHRISDLQINPVPMPPAVACAVPALKKCLAAAQHPCSSRQVPSLSHTLASILRDDAALRALDADYCRRIFTSAPAHARPRLNRRAEQSEQLVALCAPIADPDSISQDLALPPPDRNLPVILGRAIEILSRSA